MPGFGSKPSTFNIRIIGIIGIVGIVGIIVNPPIQQVKWLGSKRHKFSAKKSYKSIKGYIQNTFYYVMEQRNI